METLLTAIAAALLLTAAGYAHYRIPLTGFGLVHLPAALILFVKRGRGAGKS
ncbi:MAG TPA: hypothetical protein VGR65_07560 [Casimicrobiaceae bacterium]|jgi:hypothetical protein|nr:hypothetical protein [Casimicrobiaceae bacterium]